MLKRMLWTVILVVAILVDLWWLDRALGDYAAPIDLIAISALAIIMLFAAMQIVGLTLISQKWIDEVEIVDEEETTEWTAKDELKDLRELVDWKANQMSELHARTIKELQHQFNKWNGISTELLEEVKKNP